MGFGRYAASVSAHLKGLSLHQLKLLLLNRHIIFPTYYTKEDQAYALNVVVDVSVIFHWECRPGDSTETCVRKVGDFLTFLAHCGFIVYPICDGERGDTKIASYTRRIGTIKSNIDAQNARSELYRLRQNMALTNNHPTHSSEELKRLKKLSQQRLRPVMDDLFYEDLQKWLRQHDSLLVNNAGGQVKDVELSAHQADARVAMLYLKGKVSLIVSNDTDYLMHVGPSVIMLSSYYLKSGRGSRKHRAYERMEISNITATFSSNCALTMAEQLASETENNNAVRGKLVVKHAALPIFSEYCDPELRALIGIGLGCDIIPTGIKDLGPTFFSRRSNELVFGIGENEVMSLRKDRLMEYYACILIGKHKKDITPEMCQNVDVSRVRAYMDAIMYEPTNLMNEPTKMTSYMHYAPASLSLWCKDFTPTDSNIPIDICHIIECSGYSLKDSVNGKHKFMISDAAKSKCTQCGAHMCRHCSQKINGESATELYCCQCYKDKNLYNTVSYEHTSWSASKLKECLKCETMGGECEYIDDATLEELQRMYEMYILHSSVADVSIGQIYPVLSPNGFHKQGSRTILASTDISNTAGAFLSLDVLRPHLPSIINILASLVEFDDNYPLPKMVMDWAKKSRTPKGCTGGRLLDRAIRHVTDPDLDAYPLNEIHIFKTEGGETGMTICGTIPASMRNDEYKGSTSFTESGRLLCVECGCQAGGRDNERKNCTHGQTKAVYLTKQLTNGLSDDCLYELQAMVNSGKVTWDIFDETNLKLLIAVSETFNKSDLDIKASVATLSKDLFAVGTDRSKFRSRTTVNPKLHRPITELSKESIFTRAKKTFNLSNNSPSFMIDETEDEDVDISHHQRTNYHNIDILLEHIGADDIKCSGNLLYKIRSKKEDVSRNPVRTREVINEWENLLNAAESRKMPKIRKGIRRNRASHVTPMVLDFHTSRCVTRSMTEQKRKEVDWTVQNQRRKKKRNNTTCCFPSCSHQRIHDPSVTFTNVPKKPQIPAIPSGKKRPKKPQRLNYLKKQHRYSEFKRVLRSNWKENGKVCSKHNFIDVEKEIEGESVKICNVISDDGIYQTAETTRRLAPEMLRKVKDIEKEALSPGKIYSPSTRVAVGKVLEKLFAETDEDSNVPNIVTPPLPADEKYIPKVKPGVSDSEIHRRTGFFTEKQMLAFVIIACNGNIDEIGTTSTSLTWYEEWLFYFEWISHKSVSRWVDAVATWNKTHTRLDVVFKTKMEMIKKCRDMWPDYASHEEDCELRCSYWDEKYPGKRLVFHDDTNINLNYKPSTADIQGLTYSDYYGTNCLKGGVAIQACGWILVFVLFTGGTSDTPYFEKCKALKLQHEFALRDLVYGKVLPFLNILDKGYRCTVEAFRNGEQEVLQPTFAKKSRTFSAKDTLTTASIATDRAGNERAVNRLKTSGYIKGGVEKAQSYGTVNDAWLCYGFQVNFMFKSVMPS